MRFAKSACHHTASPASLNSAQRTDVTYPLPQLPLAATSMREATLKDLDETVELFKTVYAEPQFNDSAKGFCLAARMAERLTQNRNKYRNEFFGADPTRRYAVVFHRDNRLVGAAWLITKMESETREAVGEINKLYLLPEARGSGLGAWILKLLIEKARELQFTQLYLITARELGTAVHLYHDFGFEDIVQDRYANSPNTIAMKLRLQQTERTNMSLFKELVPRIGNAMLENRLIPPEPPAMAGDREIIDLIPYIIAAKHVRTGTFTDGFSCVLNIEAHDCLYPSLLHRALGPNPNWLRGRAEIVYEFCREYGLQPHFRRNWATLGWQLYIVWDCDELNQLVWELDPDCEKGWPRWEFGDRPLDMSGALI